MYVRRIIEKDVKCCRECPYYDQFIDMEAEATVPYCSLLGGDLNKCILNDDAGYKISDKCPIKGGIEHD